MSEALEMEIERVYCAFDRLRGRRQVYLTPCGKLRWYPGNEIGPEAHLVGTYNMSVQLEHLRADVFYIHDTEVKGKSGG